MTRILTLSSVALLTLAMAACSSKGTEIDTSGAAAGSGPDAGSLNQGNADGRSGLGNGANANANGQASGSANGKMTVAYDLNNKSVYFDYDSAVLLPAGEAVVDNWGRWLAANPQQKVTLTGHTDERGSREYNLALGEERAQSVALALKAKGAQSGQISARSAGEEYPADTGHDEGAWAKNRRVEISQ